MQVTIVTGASRGIGKAIAEDLKTLDGALIKLSSANVDFEDYQAVYDGTQSLLNCFDDISQINIVLCAAQIGINESWDLREFERLYAINVLGNLAVIQSSVFGRFVPKIRIVWFSGGGAAFPYPEFPAYSLSKVAVVRCVENLSFDIREYTDDSSIIALAPGAVNTDMLKIVEEAGCEVRTKTDISEPVNFVRKFITDEIDSFNLNGMFLHVRDDLDKWKIKVGEKFIKDCYKLRRIE